jgi:O-antigen/teichoic acid export membrane protein
LSLLKKLAGETAIYGTSSILSRLLNFFILTPFLTRIFTTQAYGVVSEMYTWAALLMILFTYRMETAFFRFGNRSGAELEKTYATAAIALAGSTLVLLGVLLLAAQAIATQLGYPQHPEYVRWFAFIIAFDALAAIPFARLRLDNRPVHFAIVKTLNVVVNIAFIFFFLKLLPYLQDNGAVWVSWLYRPELGVGYVFLSNLIASVSVLLLLMPMYRKLQWQFDFGLWREMLQYAAPLIVAGVAGVINQLMAIPMIKWFSRQDGLAQAGIYGAVAKLAVLMNLFTQAFNYAAEPFFFRHSEREDKGIIYAQVGQGFTLVGSLAFLGIMLYMDLIQFYLGKDFRTGLDVVPLLLLAYLFLGLYYNFSIWYKLADRTIIGGYIGVSGAVITLSLNYLLIPQYGYMGAGWAALACYGFMALASYWTGQRHYPIHYPVGRMAAYILVAVLLFGLSLYLERRLQPGFWAGLAWNTLLFMAYLLYIAMLERSTLRQWYRQFRKKQV